MFNMKSMHLNTEEIGHFNYALSDPDSKLGKIVHLNPIKLYMSPTH